MDALGVVNKDKGYSLDYVLQLSGKRVSTTRIWEYGMEHLKIAEYLTAHGAASKGIDATNSQQTLHKLAARYEDLIAFHLFWDADDKDFNSETQQIAMDIYLQPRR